jgi:hypothetical protein
MHNAENCGLNAYESIPDIQDLYVKRFYTVDEVNKAKAEAHEQYLKNRIKIDQDKKKSQDYIKRNYRIGGTVIGGGIGYGIGAHYAKKTPIISQQRKRKIIGTILGAAGGLAVGERLAKLHNSKITDPKFEKLHNENQEREDRIRRGIEKRFVNFHTTPDPRPETPYDETTNPTYQRAKYTANKIFKDMKKKIQEKNEKASKTDEVGKFNKRYGKFRK